MKSTTAKNHRLRKILLFVGLCLVVILGVAILFFLPGRTDHNFPAEFSKADQEEITRLITNDSYTQVADALKSRDLKWAFKRLRTIPRQKVYAVGNQPNGDHWLHVGFEDKSQTDGWYLLSRYMIARTNQHWFIRTLF
jgi:hypothetical protein